MKNEWPVLSYAEARETYETVHLWTQIIGKIKLAKMPWTNHSWHVTLHVTPTGLSTSNLMDGHNHFMIEFDLVRHQLLINLDTGAVHMIGLEGLSVAGFYKKVMSRLHESGIQVKINPIPNELANPIPLDKDHAHATYHPKHAENLHKALLNSHEVFTRFRAMFYGKCSPVHFFWGSFDLAVSRFSGRNAPRHPGGIPNLPDWVAQEAYCNEVCSSGFWPGNEAVPFAAYYTYIYPEPEGYKDAIVQPEQAYYHQELREFILPYEAIQKAENPSRLLLDFLQSTYNAAADLAHWDRTSLENDQFKEKIEKANIFLNQVDKA